MNLELLDPFRRQIPDRVDATLKLPTVLHFRKNVGEKGSADNDEDWKAAFHVAFNRRGGYIAVGYGSGTIGVYDVLSRTLCGLYRSGNGEEDPGQAVPSPANAGHGVTSLSWSRRSRALLAGAVGDREVRLMDTTHPFGTEECGSYITKEDHKEATGEEERAQSPAAESTEKLEPRVSSFARSKNSSIEHHKKPRTLGTRVMKTSDNIHEMTTKRSNQRSHSHASVSTRKRYPSLSFHLPVEVSGSLQIHPKDTCAGLATLMDGSLVAFSIPLAAWEDSETGEPPEARLATIYKSDSSSVSCAAFDPHGEKVYAATRDGKLMGFEVASIFERMAKEADHVPAVKPAFSIIIPGGASAWHVIVSRNGRYLVVNSADAAIRLYPTKECWTTPEELGKPAQVFQDVVSKVKFASCDISGDAEFVVGGANGSENKYELYIWNTSTGALMDKLTGATVELYSVAWHPTRSFLAVAASDGLVDIWGPRINWTAFAPDFQALPQNVEYVECEDEFDIRESDQDHASNGLEGEDETAEVDVLTIDPVPVFASDSEDEQDVFCFETQVTRLLGAITS